MEISFERLLALFFNKLKFILLVAIIASVATYFISDNLVEKEYTSSSQMRIPTIKATTTAAGDVINTRRLVTEYIDILDSYDFFEEVSLAVNDTLDTSFTKEQIRRNTKIANKSSDEDSSVFYISYKSTSPELAESVLTIIDEKAKSYIAKQYEDINAASAAEGLGIVEINEKPNGHFSPSSPNTRNNCIYAFIISFVLVVCFFYFREILDNRIKNVQDIATEYNLSLLGVIPDYIQQDNKKGKKNRHRTYRSYGEKPSKEETK